MKFLKMSVIGVGRYLNESIGASSSQQDLMQQTFQLKFPGAIKTVGGALNYLLHFSGYKFATTDRVYKPLRHDCENILRP